MAEGDSWGEHACANSTGWVPSAMARHLIGWVTGICDRISKPHELTAGGRLGWMARAALHSYHLGAMLEPPRARKL